MNNNKSIVIIYCIFDKYNKLLYYYRVAYKVTTILNLLTIKIKYDYYK